MRERDLDIYWPTSAYQTAQMAQSIVDALRTKSVRRRVNRCDAWLSGPQLANTRNSIVREFLAGPARWLLQVDSDMAFTPDELLMLLDACDPIRVPVLGAFALGSGQGFGPEVTPLVEAGHLADGSPVPLDHREAHGLVSVDYVGAGMLLVHRRVFQRLAETYQEPCPWFADEPLNGRNDGEDWTFCHRVRALGIPVHVHADVRVRHMKMVALQLPPVGGG